MIHSFLNKSPLIPESVFIADTASVIGDVVLGDEVGVWFSAVIRGDVNFVRIGDQTNIQDGAVVHVTTGTAPTHVGSRVTIGHGAIVHGCTIADRVLVGMGSIVLDGVTVGTESLVAAGALLPPGKSYPPRSLIVGSPGKVMRELTDEEVKLQIDAGVDGYVQLAKTYLNR